MHFKLVLNKSIKVEKTLEMLHKTNQHRYSI